MGQVNKGSYWGVCNTLIISLFLKNKLIPCIKTILLWKLANGVFLYYQNGHTIHDLLQDVKIVSGCYLSEFWVTPHCPIFSDSTDSK